MTTLQIVLCCILIPVVVSAALSFLEPMSGVSAGKTVYMPPFSKTLGIFMGGLSLGMFVASMIWTVSAGIVVAGIALCMLSLLFFAMFFSLRIDYDAHGFYVRRFFRKRSYTYGDVEAISFGAGKQYTIYLKKGRLFIDNLAAGGESFCNYAQLRWISVTGKDSLPIRSPRLFNGYLLNPVQILIGLLIAPAFATVAMLIMTIYDSTMFPPQLETAEIYVDHITYADDTLFLFCGDNTMKLKRQYLQNEAVLTQAAELETPITVTFEQTASPDTTVQVWGISVKDTTCVSAAVVKKAEGTLLLHAILIGWGVILIIWLLIAWLYYLLSHAPRFRKIMPLLVRRQYWNF